MQVGKNCCMQVENQERLPMLLFSWDGCGVGALLAHVYGGKILMYLGGYKQCCEETIKCEETIENCLSYSFELMESGFIFSLEMCNLSGGGQAAKRAAREFDSGGERRLPGGAYPARARGSTTTDRLRRPGLAATVLYHE